ncbi:hypothetical protein ACIBK9_35350 [Nonomuraea sp. NPDC050227]|uniref:hypothetical protein n=1 Tax=Nonomuraea sp. NPDC050227 TaxID=3364360 RepID=UPI00379B238B
MIRLEILDPDDLALCERFVRLHRSPALDDDMGPASPPPSSPGTRSPSTAGPPS